MIQISLAPDRAWLLLRFPWSENLIEKIRQIPGCRFHKSLGGWLIPLTVQQFEGLPRLFNGSSLSIAPEIVEHLNEIRRLSEIPEIGNDQIVAPASSADIFPTTTPMTHQRRAVELLLARPHFALFLEMGTGKTFVALAAIEWLRQRSPIPARPVLIVCPATVMSVWLSEAALHQPLLRLRLLTGTLAQRRSELADGLRAGDHAFVLNYEATWRLEKELSRVAWAAMILDESTRIKGRSTLQARAVLRLSRSVPRRWILTGTPAPNGALDLWAQFNFVDPAILGPHFYAFRERYAILGGYQGKQVIGYRHPEELGAIVRRHSFRVRKSDCLDLPAKCYQDRRLDLGQEQGKSYRDLARDLATEIRGQIVATPILAAKLVRLRQIAAGFLPLPDGRYHAFIDGAKQAALRDIILGLPPDGKLVIWGIFLHELELAQRVLDAVDKDHGFVTLIGDVPISHRGALIDEFQQEPACRYFLGQQRAGGLGITLTAASYCVFLTNDYSPEIRLQAEDRLHRIGQVNPVTYYDLTCRGTVDVAVRAALRRKQNLSDILTGDRFAAIVSGEEN